MIVSRIMRRALFRSIAAVACGAVWIVAASPVVNAHRQKMGLTEISVNARTGALEIAHQFNIHDAEHAIQRRFGKAADILGDAAVQQVFAQYVVDRFRLIAPSGDLALVLLGSEIEGSQLWVYQEVKPEVPLSKLLVEMRAMHDIWPSHVNLVNMRADKGANSLLFPIGAGAQFLVSPPQ